MLSKARGSSICSCRNACLPKQADYRKEMFARTGQGLITFGNAGKGAASAKVPVKELKLVWVSLTVQLAGFTVRHHAFLDYHRSKVLVK